MNITAKMGSGLLTVWLLLVACAPSPAPPPTPAPSIVGPWKVQGTPGLSIPHSFFWFTMDYLEFRDDGMVWGLMTWPLDAARRFG